MQTILLSAGSPDEIEDAITEATRWLRRGDIVALPTETVYGLAADATNAEACAAIFEAKQRPSFDPLIVHVLDREMLETIAEIPDDIAETVVALTSEFWPGPLTIVLPKKPDLPDVITAGLDTVAARSSSDPIFRSVVKELGRPIAAPSANRFGSMSPTSASAVVAELDGRIPLIVDGGACTDGVESTIIRIEPSGKPKPLFHLLRPGPVTVEMLKTFGKVVPAARISTTDGKPEAPGQFPSHYAPRTPLRLLEKPEDFNAEPGKSYALLSFRGQAKDGYLGLHEWDEQQVLSPGSGKLPEAAVRFFFALRTLDGCGVDEIIAEPIPERGVGLAIQDRLRRAAAKG
jgi:L-threonylcarbamoyladenylate synthase